MLVVDASVAVKLVTLEPAAELAISKVATRDDCIAPDVMMIEVASAVAKKVRFTGLGLDHAVRALQSVEAYFNEIVETGALLDSAVTLSAKLNHSLFDCTYLALAIQRECSLITADKKFAEAARIAGFGDAIEMLG